MNSKIVSLPQLPEKTLEALPEEVRAYIRHLEGLIQHLQTKVLDLEARLSKNSSNSSKPPSSDGLNKKSPNSKGSSGKKPGGQAGHAGKGLSRVSNPDINASC